MSRRSVMRALPEAVRNPSPPVPEAVEHRPPSSARLMRGQCPKCLVMYGRAMYGHVQHCNGKAEWPGAGPRPAAMIQNGNPIVAEIVAAEPINADKIAPNRTGWTALNAPTTWPTPEKRRPGRPRKVANGV